MPFICVHHQYILRLHMGHLLPDCHIHGALEYVQQFNILMEMLRLICRIQHGYFHFLFSYIIIHRSSPVFFR